MNTGYLTRLVVRSGPERVKPLETVGVYALRMRASRLGWVDPRGGGELRGFGAAVTEPEGVRVERRVQGGLPVPADLGGLSSAAERCPGARQDANAQVRAFRAAHRAVIP